MSTEPATCSGRATLGIYRACALPSSSSPSKWGFFKPKIYFHTDTNSTPTWPRQVGAQLSPAVRLQAQNPIGSRGQTRSISSSSCCPQPLSPAPVAGVQAVALSVAPQAAPQAQPQAAVALAGELGAPGVPTCMGSAPILILLYLRGKKPLFNAPTYCRWGCRCASCSGSAASWHCSRGAGGCRSRCRAAGSTCVRFLVFFSFPASPIPQVCSRRCPRDGKILGRVISSGCSPVRGVLGPATATQATVAAVGGVVQEGVSPGHLREHLLQIPEVPPGLG